MEACHVAPKTNPIAKNMILYINYMSKDPVQQYLNTLQSRVHTLKNRAYKHMVATSRHGLETKKTYNTVIPLLEDIELLQQEYNAVSKYRTVFKELLNIEEHKQFAKKALLVAQTARNSLNQLTENMRERQLIQRLNRSIASIKNSQRKLHLKEKKLKNFIIQHK